MVRPEDLSAIIAEQMAQQQVMLMALRRIATLSLAVGQDPAEIASAWREVGRRGLDRAPLTMPAGLEAAVREEAKLRLDDMITTGMR